MERLFGQEYVDGYRHALQDVLQTIDEIDDDLKWHKRRRNKKTYMAIVQCMLDNRVTLREEPWSFVRCNDECPGGFEVYNPKKKLR